MRPGLLHLAFVRSPHAHAAIVRIDAGAARARPGVAAVLTAADLGVSPLLPSLDGPGFTPTPWSPLAHDVVRFAGEPVAAVVAETPYLAADAREAVVVDYEPRPALVTTDAALAAGEVIVRRTGSRGDVDAAFGSAAVVIAERFTHGRCAAAPKIGRAHV